MIDAGYHLERMVETARGVAYAIGKVEVDTGDTSCRVPSALEYMKKVDQRGSQDENGVRLRAFSLSKSP